MHDALLPAWPPSPCVAGLAAAAAGTTTTAPPRDRGDHHHDAAGACRPTSTGGTRRATCPLGGDWVLGACEGDDPTLCYEHPDGRHGIVELFRFAAPADCNLNAHAAAVRRRLHRRPQGRAAARQYRVVAEPIEAARAARRHRPGATASPAAPGRARHRAHDPVGRHPRRRARDRHALRATTPARASPPRARAPSRTWRRSSPASRRSCWPPASRTPRARRRPRHVAGSVDDVEPAAAPVQDAVGQGVRAAEDDERRGVEPVDLGVHRGGDADLAGTAAPAPG